MKPGRILSVTDAVVGRRSVRAFLPDYVDPELIRRVLTKASRTPSGGNLQPWHITVLTGAALANFKATMARRLREAPEGEGEDGEAVEFEIYPRPLGAPYLERRVGFGHALYRSMNIARDDALGRRAWHERNYRFFDAPVGLFCHIERSHGKPQWSDLGMYLMSVMLLLREEGLESCAQESWARFSRTIDAHLQVPASRMLFCGMSIGYADWTHPANQFQVPRAPAEEYVRFLGDE